MCNLHFFSEPLRNWPQTSRKQTSVGSISHCQMQSYFNIQTSVMPVRYVHLTHTPKTDWGKATDFLAKLEPVSNSKKEFPMEVGAAHMQLLEVHGMLVRSCDSSSSGFIRVNARICKILRSFKKNKNTQHAIISHLLTISNGVLLPI